MMEPSPKSQMMPTNIEAIASPFVSPASSPPGAPLLGAAALDVAFSVRSHSSRDGSLPAFRVARASGVPLRQDQHVLADRGQVLAAERAGVGRGLAAPGGPDGPPANRLCFAHGRRLRA